jgi:hypothetical protein
LGGMGTAIDSAWLGMRHHEIGRTRGLRYEADRALSGGVIGRRERGDRSGADCRAL